MACRVWPTVEHYYQAQKFAGNGHAEAAALVEAIAAAGSPEEAARVGRRAERSQPHLLTPGWQRIKVRARTHTHTSTHHTYTAAQRHAHRYREPITHTSNSYLLCASVKAWTLRSTRAMFCTRVRSSRAAGRCDVFSSPRQVQLAPRAAQHAPSHVCAPWARGSSRRGIAE